MDALVDVARGTRASGKFRIKRTNTTRMSLEELKEAERVMARLAARAFAADHPELFQPVERPKQAAVGPDGTGAHHIFEM